MGQQILIPGVGFIDTSGVGGYEFLIPDAGFLKAPEGAPGKATSADPADDAIDVVVDQILSWTDGGGATSYDVYFGETSGALTSIGNQAGTSYDPGGLDPETEYFWRIDAVNDDGTTTGDEWSFTTAAAAAPARKATAVTVIT